MLNTYRRRKAHDEGFTLIELLIVIVILGILAAVVVFSVSGISDRGTKSACQANVTTIQTAVEAAYAQTGSYPATLNALSPTYLASFPGPIVNNVMTVGAGTSAYTVTYTPATHAVTNTCPA
jgi:prepilin-type N-terminal cleavage/methylation domain-containing protein